MLKSLTISCQQLSRIYIPNSRNITRRSYTMAVIERATLFNVASEAEGQKIIEAYKTMKTDAKKVCCAIVLLRIGEEE
jgi:putative IMPACT (imprinted ancient) family translation regulator